MGEQVRLMHVKSGKFIHQSDDSAEFIGENFSYEVSLSMIATAWTVKVSNLTAATRTPARVSNGDIYYGYEYDEEMIANDS